MESNGDQNDDLQIQNLSDDEELYQSGVEYDNKIDENKPVTIKSQHSITETEQESNKSSEYVITKEKIYEKTVTTTKVIENAPTESETADETSDGGNKTSNAEEESNENEKNNKENEESVDNNNNDKNEYDCAYSFKVDNNNKNSDMNEENKSNKKKNNHSNDTSNKLIRPRTAATGKRLRSNSEKRNSMHNRIHTCPIDKFNSNDSNKKEMKKGKNKKLHFEDENIDKKGSKKKQSNEKRKKDIENDNENQENEEGKRNTTTASTVSSKGSNTKKKGIPNKKNPRNNYRAFVSIKPSCNRYMANMWNNYVYSIHKMNILNIKKSVDNDAPKRYTHIDQKLKTKQLKKERDDEIRRENQNILNRMIYQGRNNVGTSNLDDNNDVIEPVFRSLHADQNRRLQNEMNRESQTLLKRLKEKKPYCSVEQWKKERLITEMYLRNISTYPENYPIRQTSPQKHVPPIKKNDNEELRREKSPLELTEMIYGAKPRPIKTKRCPISNNTGNSVIKKGNNNHNEPSTANSSKHTKKNIIDKYNSPLADMSKDNSKTRKPKQRTRSVSPNKQYEDTSINQNQVDRLFAEQNKDSKLYNLPESNTTAFDRVLNNFEKVENDIEEDKSTVKETENNVDNNKNINEVSEDISAHLNENENNPPIEEIPITEIEKK